MTCSACAGHRNPPQTFCGQCGEKLPRATSDSDAKLCTIIDGRFFIESKIASGGFGTVYRARSLETGQEVALKVLQAQHTADPAVSARFRREALTMSSLASPHTVTTYELGEDRDGTRFIVMELLRGESLAERFNACGTLHWRTVLGIIRAVCESLAEAHKLGVVHRDLKPANIFLCREPAPDFVKVLDFGIAKILNGSNLRDGADLTRIGQAIGTLEYMSPEQLIGGELDNRTDIYTLGVVAYEMIAGKRPFADATGATALVTALMTQKPIPLSTLVRGALPRDLDGVLLRCLERDAPDRYASVQELAAAIDRMLVDSRRDEMNTTQRQWGDKKKITPRAQVVFDCDADDELTQVDVKPPFPLKPDSKPPVDEISKPQFVGGEVMSPELPEVRFDHVVRSQLTSLPPVSDFGAEGSSESLSPRVWRAQGTGVPSDFELARAGSPFDFSDALGESRLGSSPMPTGARPLVATRYEIGRAGTEPAPGPREFPIGSSPVIQDGPPAAHDPRVDAQAQGIVMLPPAPTPIRAGRIALWATCLAAVGLGIGVLVAALAT